MLHSQARTEPVWWLVVDWNITCLAISSSISRASTIHWAQIESNEQIISSLMAAGQWQASLSAQTKATYGNRRWVGWNWWNMMKLILLQSDHSDVDVEYLSSLMFEAVLMCLHAGRSPRCFCSLRGLAGFGKFYQGYPIYIYIYNCRMYIYIFTITYTTMIIYVCFISSRRRLRGTFQDTLCCTILPPHRLAAIETARFMLIKEI